MVERVQASNHMIECMIFFISDQVDQGNLNVQYCPTDEMIGDFMTKPLQGSNFLKFWKVILGYD